MTCPFSFCSDYAKQATTDALPECVHWTARRIDGMWLLAGRQCNSEYESDLLPPLPRARTAERGGVDLEPLDDLYVYGWTISGSVERLVEQAGASPARDAQDELDQFIDYFTGDPDGWRDEVCAALDLAEKLASWPAPQDERLFDPDEPPRPVRRPSGRTATGPGGPT